MLCSNVSPLAVRQRLARHFRNIASPQMNLIYNFPAREFWITTDSGAEYGPIYPADLLPLARYLGAYRPSERCKTYALQMPNGEIIPEGKLRHALHMQFTTKALHDMMLMKAKGAAKCVKKALDTSNVAAFDPQPDLSKLYTSDVDDAQQQQLAQKLEATALSASDVPYADDYDPSP